MNGGFAGPRQLRRLLQAVNSMGANLELEVVLRRLTETAVDLLGARYGALGVLNAERTHLSDFITVGLDDDQRAVIGELPKGHGILGLLIADPRPLRLPDLNEHPESFGFPPNHPPMTSFLGVPVFVGDTVYGNLYLTDKTDAGDVFTDVDEELAVALAAAAGTAIEKARLHARVRELDMVEDRERIARDLHDTVIQQLFATGLTLQSAIRLAQPLPLVASRIEQAVNDLDLVVRQVRTSIFELHAGPSAENGLRQQVVAVGDALTEALGFSPTIHFEGPIDAAVPPEVAVHLLAVIGEALTNIARHAQSPTAAISISVADGWVHVTINDLGVGPGRPRDGGHGLANMAARAAELGGESVVEPGPDGGTRVTWTVPLGDA
ncbi:MAG: putative signal transduction histidine kinase [Acidimicrobiales bacterium]|nr:putative signal transduction histidine kinase [Acidimicrobiales bacterium]